MNPPLKRAEKVTMTSGIALLPSCNGTLGSIVKVRAKTTKGKATIYLTHKKCYLRSHPVLCRSGRCYPVFAEIRWPDGPVCPRCGLVKDHYYTETRRLWQCKGCKKQFSVKVGTVFEDSPIGMDKWLPAIWMLTSCKNGKSSHELARDLGVTQKTAWFMLRRIRLALQSGTFEKLSGEVEADEIFIGGKARNMHKKKREEKIQGRGSSSKIAAMGLLERHGEVRTRVVSDTKKKTPHVEARENVEPGSELYTDALRSYEGLDPEYIHQVIDYAEKYAEGKVHTNGLENFWSLLKRCFHGTYVSVEPFHLFRYLDE